MDFPARLTTAQVETSDQMGSAAITASFHGSGFDLVQLPRRDGDLGFESGHFIVQALADQRHGSFLAGNLDLFGKSREHLFVRQLLAVPLLQQLDGLRQVVLRHPDHRRRSSA